MDSQIEFSEVDDEDVQSEVKARGGSKIFWVLFWVWMTCILILILRLVEPYFIYDVFSRVLPGRRYLLWLPEKILYHMGAEKFLGRKYKEYKDSGKIPKELDIFLNTKKYFCMASGLLTLINIAIGLFPTSLIHALNLKLKTIDFWRLAMIGIRIYILTIFLRGKSIREIADKLGPDNVTGLLAAQYCFTSAWELLKGIESNTVIEVIVRAIGYWIITTTISKETSSLIENILGRIIRHTAVYFSEKHLETTPNSDIQKTILDFLKNELSPKVMSYPLAPIIYPLATILTPFFCIVMTYFLLKIIERLDRMVYRELEISDKLTRPYIRVITIIFIIILLLYAYHEISAVADSLEEKSRMEGMFPDPSERQDFRNLIDDID